MRFADSRPGSGIFTDNFVPLDSETNTGTYKHWDGIQDNLV